MKNILQNGIADSIKKYNIYNLDGDYGIGYTLKGEFFYFDLEDYNKIKDYCWCIDERGYISARYENKKPIRMHRLLFENIDGLYVDHINHEKCDNRKNNLRICTQCQNSCNCDRNQTIRGIRYRKNGKWEARISQKGNEIYLGDYSDIKEAILVRKKAEQEYYGEYKFNKSNITNLRSGVIFNYGVMGCGKTANLLIDEYNYRTNGFRTLIFKPSVDTRDGTNIIKSRINLENKAILIGKDENIVEKIFFLKTKIDVIFVDESQFLTSYQIDDLKFIAVHYGILIICFGLKTDFQTHLFEGSKRLLEIADSISEIKSVCRCGKKAEVSCRIENGKVVRNGEQILIGGNERYIGMCYSCWINGRV